jgi:hypothetical protein
MTPPKTTFRTGIADQLLAVRQLHRRLAGADVHHLHAEAPAVRDVIDQLGGLGAEERFERVAWRVGRHEERVNPKRSAGSTASATDRVEQLAEQPLPFGPLPVARVDVHVAGAVELDVRAPHASAKRRTRAGSAYGSFVLPTTTAGNGSRRSGIGANVSISGSRWRTFVDVGRRDEQCAGDARAERFGGVATSAHRGCVPRARRDRRCARALRRDGASMRRALAAPNRPARRASSRASPPKASASDRDRKSP